MNDDLFILGAFFALLILSYYFVPLIRYPLIRCISF